MTRWRMSHRFDRRALPLADRHYNRQTPGSPQFVPPGTCLVLLADDESALWVTSWPAFAQHDWEGAWMNTTFRNEGDSLASDLIRSAVAHTLWKWPTPPALGMVTFVDPMKVRRKRDPGRCYLRAGFEHVGFTRKGLHVLQLVPAAMPEPAEPLPMAGTLDFGGAA